MTTTKRMAAHRRKRPKSGAPRIVEGQPRPRLSLWKAGIPGTPHMPAGHDAGAFRDRLHAWTEDLGPRDAVELYLVERAVRLSWQLDGADRAQAGRLLGCSHPIDDEEKWPRVAARSPDESESQRRLRHYELACGQTLLQTLETFASLRRARTPATMQADPPLPVGLTLPVTADAATAVRSDPPSEAAPTADRPDSTDDPGPSRFARRADRLRKKSAWPGPSGHGTGSSGASPAMFDRPRPPASPEANPNPDVSRRRVGGYPVPLDPSLSVSGADKLPVRLRPTRARPQHAAAIPIALTTDN